MADSLSTTPTSRRINTSKLFPDLERNEANLKTSRGISASATPRLTPDTENRNCFISFIENVSTREVGAAVLRISPTVLTLYQFADTALYTHTRQLIEVESPTKVIIPSNSTNLKRSPLSNMLREKSQNSLTEFSDESSFSTNTRYSLVEMARSQFSQQVGSSMLLEFSNTAKIENLHFDSTDTQFVDRYLCLAAAAACIHYTQTDFRVDIYPHTLKIAFQTLDKQLMIDPHVLRQFSILSTPLHSDSSTFSSCSSSLAPSASSKTINGKIIGVTGHRYDKPMFSLTTTKRKICAPTLFNLLDRCFTVSGSRILRTSLASPPTDIQLINERHEFINELINRNPDAYYQLIEAFSSIADLDPVITFFVTKGTTKIAGCSIAVDSLQRLLYDIDKVAQIHSILLTLESSISNKMKDKIEKSNFRQINDIISDFLNPDLGIQNKANENDASNQIYAIKNGIIGILDVTRKSYEDSLSDIYNLAKELSKKYEMKIVVKYNKSRKYYFQINKSHLKQDSREIFRSAVDVVNQMGVSPSGYVIPPEFIQIVENANYVTGTTFDLLLLNKKNLSAQEDSLILTQKFVESKIDEIRPFIREIYQIGEIISQIDFLLSLTSVAREYESYCMPQYTDKKIFALRNARHPIMEQLLSSTFAQTVSSLLSSVTKQSPLVSSSENSQPSKNTIAFVPNDVDLNSAKTMMILKGINMSGKTTYLQMVVQIAIMAQTGSYVPCDSCLMMPLTSIFIRTGTKDSIEGNASAFLVEMKEMNHIISDSDSSSLIAIDEPCVSTSVRDGIGLSFACLEKLIAKHSFTICATHYNELENLAELYPSVSLKEMRARMYSTRNKYEFLYKIGDFNTSSGQTSADSGYGINLAQDYYPEDIIEDARSLLEEMKYQDGPKKVNNSGKMASYSILQHLLSLKASSLNVDGLRSCIYSLQKRCHHPSTQ